MLKKKKQTAPKRQIKGKTSKAKEAKSTKKRAGVKAAKAVNSKKQTSNPITKTENRNAEEEAENQNVAEENNMVNPIRSDATDDASIERVRSCNELGQEGTEDEHGALSGSRSSENHTDNESTQSKFRETNNSTPATDEISDNKISDSKDGEKKDEEQQSQADVQRSDGMTEQRHEQPPIKDKNHTEHDEQVLSNSQTSTPMANKQEIEAEVHAFAAENLDEPNKTKEKNTDESLSCQSSPTQKTSVNSRGSSLNGEQCESDKDNLSNKETETSVPTAKQKEDNSQNATDEADGFSKDGNHDENEG